MLDLDKRKSSLDISILDRSHFLAASKKVMEVGASDANAYLDGLTAERRIKRMKMSSYFRRPRPAQFKREVKSTALTLQEYDRLNADLQEVSKPVVKLRLDSKPRDKASKHSSIEARAEQSYCLQEVEIVNGDGIFHDHDDGLRHEMIDASKAKRIVSALTYLKKHITEVDAPSLAPKAGNISPLGDVVSVNDGKISVNLTNFQNSLELQEVTQAKNNETRQGRNENSASIQKAKVTEKGLYEAEVKRKKDEWRSFVRFAKKNPEALLGIAQQSCASRSQKSPNNLNQLRNFLRTNRSELNSEPIDLTQMRA